LKCFSAVAVSQNLPRLGKGNTNAGGTRRVKCKVCKTNFMTLTKGTPCRLYDHRTLVTWLSREHKCVGDSPNKPKATEFQINLLTYLHIQI